MFYRNFNVHGISIMKKIDFGLRLTVRHIPVTEGTNDYNTFTKGDPRIGGQKCSFDDMWVLQGSLHRPIFVKMG